LITAPDFLYSSILFSEREGFSIAERVADIQSVNKIIPTLLIAIMKEFTNSILMTTLNRTLFISLTSCSQGQSASYDVMRPHARHTVS
jgi:hypothetical protein